MATVKFKVKGTTDPSSIYARLIHGRNIDLWTTTNQFINPKHWDAKKQAPRHTADNNDYLNLKNDLIDLKSAIIKGVNSRITEGKPITKDWLIETINIAQGNTSSVLSDKLIANLERYRDYLKTRIGKNGKIGVSSGTIRAYNTTIKRIKEYQKHYKVELSLIDLDLSWHEKYTNYARTELGLSVNSIGTDIKKIKTTCGDARDKGIKVNEQSFSRKFNAPTEKTLFTTLNEVELKKIGKVNLADYLNNARDWLIIGCWTGCRFGDLVKLTMDNIQTNKDGVKYLQYTQSKTGKTVIVPLHNDVKSIIDRLEGFPRPISNVKFNKYIKTVCKNAGLTQMERGTKQNNETHLKETGDFEKWELIKSHTCRRSFATNHYKLMTNKQIMAVTGHSTEQQLLTYIGVESDDSHIKDYLKLWQSDSNVKMIGNG